MLIAGSAITCAQLAPASAQLHILTEATCKGPCVALQAYAPNTSSMRHRARVVWWKEQWGSECCQLWQLKTIVLPHSIHGTDPKVMRVEKKHIQQFSSSFYSGLNNAILGLLVDTHTLKLASPLSIKPLNLEAVLPSHQGSSSASCICPAPSLPASSALLSLSLTLLQQRMQRSAPLVGSVQTEELYVSLCPSFSYKPQGTRTETVQTAFPTLLHKRAVPGRWCEILIPVCHC